MKQHARMARALLVAAVAISGCAKQRADSTATPSSTGESPAASAAPVESTGAEHDTAAAIVPAGNVKDLLFQIAGTREALGQVVRTGELERVHHLAYGLRDQVVALAALTTAIPSSARIDLNSMVHRVKQSAELLDKAGDAGDLTGTREELNRMNGLLDAIVALVPPDSTGS